MSDQFFTVVFHGNVMALKSNPLHIKSAFGDVAIVSAGNVHAKCDAFEILNGELLEALSSIMNRHASNVVFHDDALAQKAWSAIRKATEG